MAISHFHNTDEYGFERPENFDYEVYEKFFSNYLSTLARRSKKWQTLLNQNIGLKRSKLLKRYIRKGIPSSQRKCVWLAIAGVSHDTNASQNFYKSHLHISLEPELFEVIRADLPRTFPTNIFFNKEINRQNQLCNILVAYANANKNVGYCQGLNYIAGLLLLITDCESSSFFLLKYLVEDLLPSYYTRSMDGLIVDIKVLSELIRIKFPDVYKHIVDLGMPWPVIFTKWFVCLFAEVLPTETVLRLWDCLFYEGSKILFRAGLTLVHILRSQIMKSSDFTSLFQCFQNVGDNYSVLDCHEFMKKKHAELVLEI
ncbi:growth hormone-regulated TBC protein 1-A-like [Ctenocephalides felis]|uniref:growth hormone-regulated TBC protein 1-A-like n=1 Tax=Ctenocephalides felis TaxID=7515 RepID=UPI000E6E33E7|nr:growth hormone-regulated TBC protein 1-A-like [Ctenocephalides felis]